jgi:hypothetical protein
VRLGGVGGVRAHVTTDARARRAQVSLLQGDHEQHMLPLQEGFKAANEAAYGPVFARRAGRRCALHGVVTGGSGRGNREGALVAVLPPALWPPYRVVFNGSYCTAEGHFCGFSVHVCPTGQVRGPGAAEGHGAAERSERGRARRSGAEGGWRETA